MHCISLGILLGLQFMSPAALVTEVELFDANVHSQPMITL
jgi:hypothetical protein